MACDAHEMSGHRTTTTREKLVFPIAIAAIMVDGFDLQMIGFVAPEIARSWGLDIQAFAPVFSAALAGSILGALIAGPAARRWGQRLVLAVSLALFGACTLATPLANDLTALILLRFVAGLGLGATVPLLMAIVAEHSPTRFRATLITLTLCGQPIGAVAGAALCARFIPVHGWQFAFYLGGILPLLLIGTTRLIPSRSTAPGTTHEQGSGRLRDLFGNGLLTTTALLWTCSFLTVFFIYIIINWLPSSLRSAGYSLETSVLAISLFNLGGIGGALFFGIMMSRYRVMRVVPIAFALAAVSMAVLDVAHAFPALLLTAACLCGLTGYGGSMSFGSLATLLYPPSLRVSGAGWVLGVGRLGAALGPLGAGLALSRGLDIASLFYFAAAAAAGVTLCLMLLARMRSQMDTGVLR